MAQFKGGSAHHAAAFGVTGQGMDNRWKVVATVVAVITSAWGLLAWRYDCYFVVRRECSRTGANEFTCSNDAGQCMVNYGTAHPEIVNGTSIRLRGKRE